ncbi:apicoplast triosephosphate translocator APT1 [Toxoplasma gondii RUB]|uniref:Apicoplast triosephosphate translocator APT1 n=12 Tax=Toxoplasma gondii TaxID=5811 RepID=A0A0F7V2H9_TOXGV|nr:apicoplast triosephosphate translocator [Toxoplasma gondii]EPR62724.1 apicoplast triosephosphate translocator APT1 [Toxoplasma gondii GT1]ESS32101.1 apicoplast triosephosphate translocator APT1 [Toxoplasma gondii VEG]KFG39699.1 apicoplast triosephosphate translocator APT1 [Toxoplasma gondii p89]KFG49326.1 apicoplast triosephosphate translocator APT1 [Toxoplasma gondii GAB2-2007-GAL-DOM2]KFG52787.1 apicoplast triosephosphate translocator APT1 [Toxoplasma gondii FOU]KFG65372.1 apicoplast tri
MEESKRLGVSALPPQYGTVSTGGARPAKDLESQASPASGDQTAFYAQLGVMLLFWYALNVMYNLDNKLALIMLPLPWTVSTFQLFFGWLFFGFAWATGLRPVPRIHTTELFVTRIAPQGLCHFFVHIGAVISMGCGAVSFTHIVKASEPVLTALLSGLALHQVFSWQTYLSLVPIVAGVIMASVTELSFTWKAFGCALVSALGSSARAVFAKLAMADRKQVGENLSSANMYALLTIVASLVSLPLAIFAEGAKVAAVWEACTGPDSPWTGQQIIAKLCFSGLWYYMYNEVAYLCLEKINQVTHAVANTLKRVVIIVASVLFFQTPVTALGATGSFVAIAGTLIYSLSKTKYG